MMSATVTSSPANHDRPLLTHLSSRSSNQRRIRTLFDLLTIDKTDGVDRTMRREESGNGNTISKWKLLKERLGLNAIGCCGVSTWQFENSSSSPEQDTNIVVLAETHPHQLNNAAVDNVVGSNGEENMNLAAALAAERQFRAVESTGSYSVDEGNHDPTVVMTPSRVSLMRLLEETSDGCDLEREISKGGDEGESEDSVCCVCMERKKGAAFIPCGHTYCRVCCREVWLSRGSCPLCNRRILEILDIF